ncbi:MAG: LysE family translocator [Pseudomonadota bacterium]
MFDIAAIASAAAVCLAGVMSPGPNFVAVTHRAASTTRHEALTMVLGIAIINLLWAAISVFGIGLLLATAPPLFWTVKTLGAMYLIWFGVKLIRRPDISDPAARLAERAGFKAALRDGIATNLANPNSMMFYASVFAGAVPADASLQTLLSLVAMVGLIGMLWYGSVALVFSSNQVASFYRRGRKLIECACGLFLIGFAIRSLLAN